MENDADVNDEFLMQQVANQDDRQALGILYLRYFLPIVNAVCGIVGNRDKAQDVVNDTFIKIWIYRRSMHHGKFRPFAFSVAYSVAKDLYKYEHRPMRRKTQSGIPEGLEPVSDHDPIAMLEHDEDLERMREHLQHLPPFLAETVKLVRLESRSYDKVAQLLHIPTGTVKSRVNYAIRLLRESMTLT